MMDVFDLAWLIILLPLAGALVCGGLALAGVRRGAHWPAILAVGGAAGIAMGVLYAFVAHPPDGPVVRTGYDWLQLGRVWTTFSIQIDGLTAVMLATVTTVSFLILMYSRGYMADDPGYGRYFAFLSLFVAAMCTLVLAGNFVVLYLGWEAVGLCSYLLIGFWYRRPAAANAAVKAFVVNRIGDLGFALGILTIFLTFGTFDYAAVFSQAGTLGDDRATLIALLLFCGAIGKSAQLPLYVWLPDAMEGPTPVSALIHAATMVTAGVYMVARCGAIFAESTVALPIVAVVGAVTALYAATIAAAQYDIKRILAYSTISQLGYMFLAVGVLVPAAGVFHLVTHAFFKALLFLAAGAVMHAMAGVVDIRRIGGLRRVMPVTYVTCLIGCLALAGVFPLAGFWSKDPIILVAWARWPALGILAALAAAVTTFYIFRMFFRTFHGRVILPDGAHTHDVGPWMRWPMIVLAVASVGIGYTVRGPIRRLLDAEPHHAAGHTLTIVLTVATVGLIAVAYLVYRRGQGVTERLADRAGLLTRLARAGHTLLNRKYYVDELVDTAVVKPARGLADGCHDSDNTLIDGLLAGIVAIPTAAGHLLRLTQRGVLQGYALMVVIFMMLMLLAVVFLT